MILASYLKLTGSCGFHARFWDTPVVKSSSRELCYIILAGIFLGYLCTFSLIAKPHVVLCYLQRLGIGLSPAMSYSALVTKVQAAEGMSNFVLLRIPPCIRFDCNVLSNLS